jgi:hypothetical protein
MINAQNRAQQVKAHRGKQKIKFPKVTPGGTYSNLRLKAGATFSKKSKLHLYIPGSRRPI